MYFSCANKENCQFKLYCNHENSINLAFDWHVIKTHGGHYKGLYNGIYGNAMKQKKLMSYF